MTWKMDDWWCHLLAPSFCLKAALGTPCGPNGSDSITWKNQNWVSFLTDTLRRGVNLTYFFDQFISLHFLGRSLHRGLRWTCPLWGRRSWWQWRESWRLRTRIRRFGRWFSSLEFAERNDSESVSMLHQLTVRLYQHSSKDGTTEAAKTMVNTLKRKMVKDHQWL